jgi:hypothetical protein
MAKKLNVMTFMQQVEYLAKVNWRRPRPQLARVLVVPAPSSTAEPARKLKMSITAEILADTQFPVAIIQVKDNAGAFII